MIVDFITPVVHGHGRGTRLGTCLVQLQCVSCVAASAARVLQINDLLLISLHVVHGHGRGTRLGTCLVQLQCVSCVAASAACVTANKGSVVDFITPVVHGHGRGTRLGTCLVQLQCVSCVACLLCSMFQWLDGVAQRGKCAYANNAMVLYEIKLITPVATRHAPWYVPSASTLLDEV